MQDPQGTRATAPEAAASGWIAGLSSRRYRLLLLCLCAAAAGFASEGVQRLAALRANYYLAADRAGAVSPLVYGARLPALHAAAAAPGPVRALVRADSAGRGSGDLCALASALKAQPGVVWLAATPAVEPCIATSAGIRAVPVTAAAKTELARARWVLLDAGGTVLHSGRTVPAAADVRELAALLSPAPAPAGAR
ncbi:MAG: hypothetical protein KY467_05745 [Gemmatimonadetes bacterium]|nr:hypothetical protein [Gemmatimonadota bacterium]